MTAAAPEIETRVSLPCLAGKHSRCTGSVAVYPRVDGKTLVPCACPEECSHGAPDKGSRRPSAAAHRRPTTLRGAPRD